MLPLEYFKEKAPQIKDFLRKYRNTKVRMILVCLMEKDDIIKDPSGESKITYITDKAYFHSQTHINLEKTDVKVFLKDMIKEILVNLANYQKKRFRLVFQRSYQT